MKKVFLIASIVISGLATSGCQPESTVYQYRAGSSYEYKQLFDAWIPNNDTLPPLPSISEDSQGGWVQVPVAAEPVSSANYQPRPKIYVGAGYGWDWPYRSRHRGRSYWRGRRGHYGSGLSIGFSFGSGPHRPGWGRYGYWDDWNRDWSHTGAYGPRYFRW